MELSTTYEMTWPGDGLGRDDEKVLITHVIRDETSLETLKIEAVINVKGLTKTFINTFMENIQDLRHTP